MPDAATHVSLFEGGTDPLNIVASGHGASEPHCTARPTGHAPDFGGGARLTVAP